MTATFEWLPHPDSPAYTGAYRPMSVPWGAEGRYWSPVAVTTLGTVHGTIPTAGRLQAKTFVVPLDIDAATSDALDPLLEEWISALFPLGPQGVVRSGTLRYTRNDGQVRLITCRAREIRDRERAGDEAGPEHQRFVVQFVADCPLYMAEADTAELVLSGAAAGAENYLPLPTVSDDYIALTSSSGTETVEVTNPGTWTAEPVWTINGPATSVLFRLESTGQEISLPTLTLAVNEGILVDTRPFRRPVTDLTGANLFSLLAQPADLWHLPPGTHPVTVTVGGMDTATRVELRRRHRYLSA